MSAGPFDPPPTTSAAPDRASVAKLHRAVRVRFLVCFGVMAAIFGLSHAAVALLPTPSTAEVNVAGRQRMLSQRIARLAEVLASSPTGRRAPEARSELEGAIEQLETNLESLVHGAESRGISPLDDEILMVTYGAPRGLQSEVAEYVGYARRILSTPPELLTPSHPLLSQLRKRSDLLLGDLERAAERHQAVVDGRFALIRQVDQGLTVFHVLSALLLGLLILKPVLELLQGESRTIDEANRHLREEGARREFETTLARALDMSLTEAQVLEVTSRALARIDREMPSELLLADASNAHMRLGAADAEMGSAGCTVSAAFDCPAIRKGQTLTFASSTSLDACPFLRDRLEHSSAACTPVSFMGQALGVLHQLGPVDSPIEEDRVDRLRTLGIQVGTRLGTVRSFAKVERQAQRDSLTGLLNRRALEDRMQQLVHGGRSFSLAMADMDRFKRLNDTFGHEAGDRALRTLAKVFEDVCRQHDLLCRWGGEEFVLVWPDVGIETAEGILGRVRKRLEETCLSQAEHPSFTGSYGLVHSSDARTWQEALNLADQCLMQAKAQGRDRVVRYGKEAASEAHAPTTEEPDLTGEGASDPLSTWGSSTGGSPSLGVVKDAG